jgi:hypothetical protein
MQLQHVNNSAITSLNNDSGGISRSNTTNEIHGTSSSAVNISVDENGITQRSTLSNEIGTYLNHLSNIGAVSTAFNQQLDIIDNIQNKVVQLSNGSSQESIQPTVAQLISNYNVSVKSIIEKIAKLEDLKGDSTTYFDGQAGAIPLDIEILNNEISNKKVEINSTLEQVSQLDNIFKKEAKNLIVTEVNKTREVSPFKDINFGKESADFNSNSLGAIVGSVASSQANAMQSQNIKLLS